MLKSKEGNIEHYYMIPMKGRFLAIPIKEDKERKIWDGKKAVKLW